MFVVSECHAIEYSAKKKKKTGNYLLKWGPFENVVFVS